MKTEDKTVWKTIIPIILSIVLAVSGWAIMAESRISRAEAEIESAMRLSDTLDRHIDSRLQEVLKRLDRIEELLQR
jgi:hypothetical protein